MTYEVTIKQKHCVDKVYVQEFCPLRLAVDEQHPKLNIKITTGTALVSRNGKTYYFDFSYKNGWHYERFKKLHDKKIKQFKLLISDKPIKTDYI